MRTVSTNIHPLKIKLETGGSYRDIQVIATFPENVSTHISFSLHPKMFGEHPLRTQIMAGEEVKPIFFCASSPVTRHIF